MILVTVGNVTNCHRVVVVVVVLPEAPQDDPQKR